MEISPSLSLGKKVNINAMNNVDRISNLPNDILKKILSDLSTEETIRTSILSKRWMSVWKQMSHLVFDMRKIITINGIVLPSLLDRGAALITKVINNHIGHLETCIIFHYTYQCEDGTLDSWIRLLTGSRNTKTLMLANFLGRLEPKLEANVLNLSPKTLSHPNLTTLSLSQYIIMNAHIFNHCSNLKRLELLTIVAEVDVFNKVISSCPSIEVLVIQIFFLNRNGHFKINHDKLKILLMSCNEIDGIDVFATRLDMLSVEYILCEREKVVFEVPRLQFSRNYWVVGGLFPHTSYNISGLIQEEESNGIDQPMVVWPRNHVTRPTSLSVSVDLKNPREVEILRETLGAWAERMLELEILFKNNNSLGESSTAGAQNKLWENTEPFPNADFRVGTVWMPNFSGSSEEEFALASRFVMQDTVMNRIMIKTSSFPHYKKLVIEDAVAKLRNLPKGNEEFSIQCF